jgi:hypothetical protein
MGGQCNTDVIKTVSRGWFGSLHVWLNKNEIGNLVDIPMLGADRCKMLIETKEEWTV